MTLLAQSRPSDVDASKMYAAYIAPEYDAESGAWGPDSSLSDHYWGWSWHDAQADLPTTMSIPLQ